jgi:prepilin-type processing-associated H-X9-DG protein
LVELLVITAIFAVLAAVLYPVFRQTIDLSKGRSCASNFHQASLATSLYADDYEDRLMPVSDQPSGNGNSHNDHTWVQVVLPYTRSFSIFHCPADTSGPQATEATFDQDLVPGDTYSEYYTASLHVNLGYNYQYLAPILLQSGRWASAPITTTEVQDPSEVLLFVDSVWALANGGPSGGGSWLVVPPCRYSEGPSGQTLDTFLVGQDAEAAFVMANGWSGGSSSPLQYGGAWPWHLGRMNVAHIDGSVKSITPAQLGAGCNVQPNWSGQIEDGAAYMWDPRLR